MCAVSGIAGLIYMSKQNFLKLTHQAFSEHFTCSKGILHKTNLPSDQQHNTDI